MEKFKDSKFNHAALREKLKDQYEAAMLDCMALGYGFVVFKRLRGQNTFDVKHLSWSDVKDALSEMGVVGPFRGGDKD